MVVCAVLGLLMSGVRPAAAQGVAAWSDRGYFNFNVGFETTSGTLTDAVTFRLYDESGTKSVEQNVDSGSLVDFSVGGRVWRNVSVGIGYHRGANTSEASATASVPHPLVFASNRAVATAAGDLQRVEQGIHIQIGYMIPITDTISVHVMGGPSFFRLAQDVLSDVTFTEAGFPFTTVNGTPVISERNDSAVGVNLGADVSYRFYDSDAYTIGAGMFIRYAAASARITIMENEVDSDVGGMQLGFGLRVRF